MTSERSNNKVDRVAAETSDIKSSPDLKRQLKELQSRLNVVERIEFLSEIYNYLLNLDVKDDPIQWRILCVLFSRFDTYCQDGMKCDIIHVISTLIKSSVFSSQEIQQNMREWIKKGQRYQLLLSDLGGPGNLLVLPDDHGESFWTKTVPKEGNRRDNLIQSLLKRGIHRQAYGIDAHKTTIDILDDYLEQMIYSSLELLNLSQWKGKITLYYDPQLVMEIPIQPENWNNIDANQRSNASITHLMTNKTYSALAPQRPEPGQNTMSMQIASEKHNTRGESIIQNNIILPPIHSLFSQSYDREGKSKHHLDTNDTISNSESTPWTTSITSRKRMRTSHAALDPSPPNTSTQAQRNIHSGTSEDQDRAANLMHEPRSLIEESGYTRYKHPTSHLDPLTHVPDSANTIGENQSQSWPSTTLRPPIQPLPDSAIGENQYQSWPQSWPSTSVHAPIQPLPGSAIGENQYQSWPQSWPSTSVRAPIQPLPDSAIGENQYQSWPSTSVRAPNTSIRHDASQNDTEPANDLNSSTTVHPFYVFDYTVFPLYIDDYTNWWFE